MGLGRFELPTSPLSGVRSSQLSYRPAAPQHWALHEGRLDTPAHHSQARFGGTVNRIPTDIRIDLGCPASRGDPHERGDSLERR